MDYRNQYCTPKPIKECILSDKEIIMPMEAVVHHDMAKLFNVVKPNLKDDMKSIKEKDPAAQFKFSLKYGM